MKKVKFKKWVPLQYKNEGGSIEGTGCFETEYINDGVFHAWGASFEEFETGPGNQTVAIIEEPNGEITQVSPENIKFVSLNKTSDIKEAIEQAIDDNDPSIKELANSVIGVFKDKYGDHNLELFLKTLK